MEWLVFADALVDPCVDCCSEVALNFGIAYIADGNWMVAIDIILDVIFVFIFYEWGPVICSRRVSAIGVYFTHYVQL